MKNLSNRRKVILLGASGVTGKCLFVELLKKFSADDIILSGRKIERISSFVASLGNVHRQYDLSKIEILYADTTDYHSLLSLCRRGKLILNCAGPYIFSGDHVVKAAIESGVNYIDACGEPYFLETIEDKYNDLARVHGVYVINSCAFAGVPADLGTSLLRDSCSGNLLDVQSYFSVHTGLYGYVANQGTWKSAIYSIANENSLLKLREQRNLHRLQLQKVQRARKWFKHPNFGYCAQFQGVERSIVYRTQLHRMVEKKELNAFRFTSYFVVKTLPNLVIFLVCSFIFRTFSKSSLLRHLLIRNPEFFSVGHFTKRGPSREQMQRTTFTWKLDGFGCSQLIDPEVKVLTKLNSVIFKGPDPGYIGTAMMMAESASCMIEEPDKMPKYGGVYTPSIAFERTSFIDRLKKSGFQIECHKN